MIINIIQYCITSFIIKGIFIIIPQRSRPLRGGGNYFILYSGAVWSSSSSCLTRGLSVFSVGRLAVAVSGRFLRVVVLLLFILTI